MNERIIPTFRQYWHPPRMQYDMAQTLDLGVARMEMIIAMIMIMITHNHHCQHPPDFFRGEV
jgi:hypothetical protein